VFVKKPDPEVNSIAGVIKGSEWIEREIAELLGSASATIQSGAPAPAERLAEGEFSLRRTHERIVPSGLSTRSRRSRSFSACTGGETVVKLDIELGYNHRGIEKLAEKKSWDQVVFLVERICGICSTSHPRPRCGPWRTARRSRRRNAPVHPHRHLRTGAPPFHLSGLPGRALHGYNTVWMWSWKYRETVCDIFEKITGNRQSYAMFKAGACGATSPLRTSPGSDPLWTD